MRAGPALLAAALLVHGATAMAQGVNQGALDALTPPKPAQPRRPAASRPARQPKPEDSKQGAQHNAAKPPAPVAMPVPPRPPALPVAPPAIAALPPPIQVPVARPQPPPPVPVSADAPGVVAPVSGGVRTTFGPDRSDLNAETEEAIRAFARGVKDGAGAIHVMAYAAGAGNDPSAPRRLSLARALAARAVLMNEGIASTRIYVRALGVPGGDGPADRVDVTTDPALATAGGHS